MSLNISFNQPLTAPLFTKTSEIILNVKPLAILAIGIVIYFFFIFTFYKYLARRDILLANWNHKYSWDEGHAKRFFKTLLYLLEYVVVVPALIFIFFLVMATILLFVSDNSPEQILLISMAIVTAGRLLSYCHEELAREVGKLMPLTLMAIFISDMSSFSLQNIVTNAKAMLSLTDKLFFYLMFAVALEFILRIIQLIIERIKKNRGIKKSLQKKAGKQVRKIEQQSKKTDNKSVKSDEDLRKIDI